MHFELGNEYLQSLAAMADMSEKGFATKLMDTLYDECYISDGESQYYGVLATQVYDCNDDEGLKEILHEVGIPYDKMDRALSLFACCKIMGDGDCPECGYDMEITPLYDWDNWTEKGDEYICPNCGHRHID